MLTVSACLTDMELQARIQAFKQERKDAKASAAIAGASKDSGGGGGGGGVGGSDGGPMDTTAG